MFFLFLCLLLWLFHSSFESLPIINKLKFHVANDSIVDRLDDRLTIEQVRKFLMLRTSGSTTGKPSVVPFSEADVMHLRNYYVNLGRVSGGLFPSPDDYCYITMFPSSGDGLSSTGMFSEMIIPEKCRLGRSEASASKSYELIMDGFFKNGALLQKKVHLVLGGLPILHLQFIEFLQRNREQFVLRYLKEKGICVYGGEAPTLQEKLKLYQVYIPFVL
jgi:hypothetical protein